MLDNDLHISVQTTDFDVATEYCHLSQHSDQHSDQHSANGAIVTFVGLVRDFNAGVDVNGLILEHYSGMTEKVLAEIASTAASRWPLTRIRIIHRVGELSLASQIVFVGVASAHRAAAFAGCEYIIDQLKTQAPFWKKEMTKQGARWVSARLSDQQRADQWQ